MSEFLKYFLPPYLLLFYGLGFFWRLWVVWKRTGLNPYTYGRTDTLHDVVGGFLWWLVGLTTVIVGVYAVSDAGYALLGPLRWLEHPLVAAPGVGLLLIALLVTLIAQIQMGVDWRVGVDAEHRTGLVEHGLFRFSRNPIFLSLRLAYLGLFLILPNAVTLTTLVLAEVLLQIQVRLEEEHLTQLHGNAYRAYCRRVRRWL